MELLERHFEIALETPDGIKKLRELILSLAMKGKLVPQDPKDQPASELFKQINSVKLKLIELRKIKKHDVLKPITVEEIPFSIPKKWLWVRLNDVFDVRDGTHDTPKYVANGIPLVTSKNIYTGKLNFSDIKFISEEDHLKIKERSKVDKGDILFAMIGSIGNPVVVDTANEFSIKNVALFKYYDKRLTDNVFLHNYLVYAQKHMKDISSGAVQSFVSLGFLRNFLFPLPPLPEQKRIVAKIDQLMALCDKLETERTERSDKRLKIHTAAMTGLFSASDRPAFHKSWAFITKNFSELYSVPENVGELKKAILQLAVMGKLVPQDPKEQPASELLKEIEEEKKRLVKEGKIKKQEPIESIKTEEIPYKLPNGWQWCYIRDICHDWAQKIPNKRFTYIDVGSVDNKKGEISSNVQLLDPKDAPSRARKIVKKGTVIYSTVRPYLLNIAIIEQEYGNEPIASTAFAILHPFTGICNKYIYYYLHSISFIEYVQLQMKGVAYPAINDGNFYRGPFPLPPLPEQKRIVAKIDQLMAICNTLEHDINDSINKQTAILNAVLSKL